MQIVIDISDEMYQAIKSGMWCGNELWYNALKNGIPLPKGHGRLIDESVLRNLFDDDFRLWWGNAVEKIEDLPTIIEADKEIMNDSKRKS